MGMSSFLKLCPLCHTGNEPNAIICRNCGAHIELRPNVATTRLDKNSVELSKPMKGHVDRELGPPSSGVLLYLLSRDQPIALCLDEEFILGRAGEPMGGAMIDLTEFDGFGMGISRRHAMIRAAGNGYQVIDLGSSNGTWLNGKRLVPNHAYDLPSGAVLQLGRLKLTASYVCPPVVRLA